MDQIAPPSGPGPGRTLIHRRDIAVCGYEREDGLFDIEAELSDIKSYAFDTEDRGRVEPGEKLHGMVMRMTVDENYRIVAADALTRFAPYSVCSQAADFFSRIAGLTIGRGFLKEALSRMAGVSGCTHQREVLQQMATVAFQTIATLRMQRRAAALGSTSAGMSSQRGLVNTCHGYSSDGPVVERRWPEQFTGTSA